MTSLPYITLQLKLPTRGLSAWFLLHELIIGKFKETPGLGLRLWPLARLGAKA
jgi:hypothetical protein